MASKGVLFSPPWTFRDFSSSFASPTFEIEGTTMSDIAEGAMFVQVCTMNWKFRFFDEKDAM